MERRTFLAVVVFALTPAGLGLTRADPVPEGWDARFRGRFEEAQAAVYDKNYHLTEFKVTVALAMQPEPKVAAALYEWRDWAYFHMGDFQRTLADYNSALRLDPMVAHGYRPRAWLHYRLGHFAEAVSDYTHALSGEESSRWNICQDRGDAYAKLGKRDPARRDYERAVQRPTKSAANYATRANLFRQLGQLERAAADFATAKRMRPSDPRVLKTDPEGSVRQGERRVESR